MIYLTSQRLELTARASLIPGVISFGRKLVKKSERVDDFQTYTKTYEISGPPSTPLTPSHPAIRRRRPYPLQNPRSISKSPARKSLTRLGGVASSPVGGEETAGTFFALIRQRIWRLFYAIINCE